MAHEGEKFMIEGILILALIITVLAICISFKLIGWLFKIIFFLVLGLPLTILFLVFGALLCATIIFIPLGLACFKLIGSILSPLKPRAA
jgi:uncharacterized membrane protein YccF (DUF307 family)